MSVEAGEKEYFFVLQPVFAEVYWSQEWGNCAGLFLDSINLFCCYRSPKFLKKIWLRAYSNNSTVSLIQA